MDTLDTLHDIKRIGEDTTRFNGKSTITACSEPQKATDSDLTNTSLPLLPLTTQNKEKIATNDLIDIAKDVQSFTNFMQNLIGSKLEKRDSFSDRHDRSNDGDFRGGKYNKKAAPPPPSVASPIKATLTLKPGVVKTVGAKESPCKEVFVHSPKSKRKLVNTAPSTSSNTLNRSPSSVSNASKSKALSRLMRFPKKIGLWSKDELSAPKRSSWHCYMDSDKSLSKSDNDLSQETVGGGLKAGSQLSVRSLTDSPLARRRLRIIRRYVDEDID